MGEISIFAPLTAALSPLLSGAALFWLIQRGFAKQDEAQRAQGEDIKSIKGRMDCFEAARHSCQIDVAKHYATKEEVARVSVKLDDHAERISSLEAEGRR